MESIRFKIVFFLIVLFFFNNIRSRNKIVTVSIPKCGTALLAKCLCLLRNQIFIPSLNRLYLNINQIINSNKIDVFITHALYTKENLNLIEKNDFKGIFISRDPRDQIVSLIYYIYNFPLLYASFFNLNNQVNSIKKLQKYSFDELFFKLIKNYWYIFSIMWNVEYKLNKSIKTIANVYKQYLNWKDKPYIYSTTFEKLVGPKGGGNKYDQLIEIQNIARHIELTITLEKAEEVAENLFGGTSNFREGKIGSWKSHFTEKHKEAFKKVAGELLIDLDYEKNMNW